MRNGETMGANYSGMNDTRMMDLFRNWLEVISDHASDDANVDGVPESYEEFADYAVSALEDILMEDFYDFYMNEYSRRQGEF